MKKFKWFWSWQDEKIENWLQEMALSGWKLSTIPLPGLFSFESIPPAAITYRLDYHNRQKIGMNAYLDTFLDDGWEFITKLNGWLYFSKPLPASGNQLPELSVQPKIDKLTHQLSIMGSFVPLMTLWFPLFGNHASPPFRELLLVVYVLSLVIFLMTIIKGYQRVRELKKQS
ncbi:DUF2812 domain-containing protein [Pelolinea submarina]|uniref:Uncharacterized protein DUF2812 n=1 Tax=Pelolinea submarina TaxID=913107 RepID=A0A347ZPE2_9CHLR|nr:DUF2812 domain-containing protein [Pelolinea submarina]REG08774.1 uncharacterized protein DUF2812 [Pelolinea submarina]BBB47173.1 hypothetical protein Pelsub_P0400 [Pelolinea submarina]